MSLCDYRRTATFRLVTRFRAGSRPYTCHDNTTWRNKGRGKRHGQGHLKTWPNTPTQSARTRTRHDTQGVQVHPPSLFFFNLFYLYCLGYSRSPAQQYNDGDGHGTRATRKPLTTFTHTTWRQRQRWWLSIVHVMGLHTHVGTRVWVAWVRVRVWHETPAENPHPRAWVRRVFYIKLN